MDNCKTEHVFASWRGREPISARADAVYQRLASSFDLEQLLLAVPFEALEQAFRAQDPMRGYGFAGPEVRSLLAKVPADVQGSFLTSFLVWAMTQFERRFSATALHSEFRLHYADAFHRILDRTESEGWAPAQNSDEFMKELGLARLTIIPAVAQLIYPSSGLEARTVLKAGPTGWWHVYGRCGGRRPFLEIHTHDPWIKDYFNPAGWEETYRLTALALASMPKHRGMLGSSWFYDPQLDDISPRLRYLRERPLSGGATLLKIGTSDDVISNATATSETRRNLYEAGQFMPIGHALVWPRDALLKAYSG